MMKTFAKEVIVELKDAELRMRELEELHGFTSEVEQILYSIAEFCVENNISAEEYDDLCAREWHMKVGLIDGRDCHFCKYDCICKSWWKTHRLGGDR